MESPTEKKPTYLVDESGIEAQQDKTISETPELRDHIGIINAALDCISKLLYASDHSNDDELAALRLAIRCFNSSAASLRLLRCGYYQPSFAMVRDLVETTFLLDLFQRDKAALREWRTLPAKERERRFSPFGVRKRLDDMDGYKEAKRAAAYKMLSTYAAHPSPEGFRIISPNNMTQVGPFPDAGLLTAGLQELSKHLAYSAIVIITLVESKDFAVLSVKQTFFDALERWRDTYMPREETADDRE